MTIEVSTPHGPTKAGAANAGGNVKLQGQPKGASSIASIFSAILADQGASDNVDPTLESEGLFESKLAPTQEGIAQPAIDLVADDSTICSTHVDMSALSQANPQALVLELPPAVLSVSTSPAAPEQGPAQALVSRLETVSNGAVTPALPGETAKPAITVRNAIPFSPPNESIVATVATAAESAIPSKTVKFGFPTDDKKSASSASDVGKLADTKLFAVMEAIKSLQAPREVSVLPAAVTLTLSGVSDVQKNDKAAASLELSPLLYAPNQMSLGTTSYASTAVVDAAAISPEFQVAEQVAYWITQDVQNAEIKLDGLGLDPVEVSIRMSGNEAQVSFRTDEIHTRDLLDSASTHLKEMLQSQGIVLSGVSVGTSGSGGHNGGQKATFQAKRPSSAQQGDVSIPPSRSISVGHKGNSLDLFV
jgi:flagellar hook-length control protein FliK